MPVNDELGMSKHHSVNKKEFEKMFPAKEVKPLEFDQIKKVKEKISPSPEYTIEVLCLDDRGFQRRIKKGNRYMAECPANGTITIKDDQGNPCTCPKHLFGKVLVSSLDEQIDHVTEIIKIMKLNPEKSFAFCFASVMKVQIQQLATTIIFMNWRKFLGEETIGNDHVKVIQYLERFKNALIAVSVESNKKD